MFHELAHDLKRNAEASEAALKTATDSLIAEILANKTQKPVYVSRYSREQQVGRFGV